MDTRTIHKPLIAAGVIMLLVAVLTDPALRGLLTSRDAGAVGGYSASNVLGPDNFTGVQNWTLATADGLGGQVTDSTFDSANGILYVTDDSAVITKCDITTDCDVQADWVTAFTAPSAATAIAYDSGNSMIYAGVSGPAAVYRCNPEATDCPGGVGWSQVFDVSVSGTSNVNTIFVDTANNDIYVGVSAGNAPGNIVYRCDITADGCNEDADWNGALDEAGASILDITKDTANEVLYAAGFDQQDVNVPQMYRCPTSAGCESDADWEFIGGIGGENMKVSSVVFDATNEHLYAGNDGSELYTCDASILSCGNGDWSLVSSTKGGAGLLWDGLNDVLYSGASGGVYRCQTADGCETGANWDIVLEFGLIAFVMDTTVLNPVIYGSSGGNIYRCETSTGCDMGTELSSPNALVYDATNSRLFVSDSAHNRVVVYDASDGFTDGEDPVYVVGQTDLNSFSCNRGGSAANDTLCAPSALAYDSTNARLFVTDATNSRVMIFDVSLANIASDGNGTDAINVIGQPDFTTTDSGTTARAFSVPEYGLALDGSDRLFVADGGNSRVMIFDVSLANIASDGNGTDATAVIGQDNFTSGNDPEFPTRFRLCGPKGLAHDATGQRLFVAETGSCGESGTGGDRVTIFDVSLANIASDGNGTDAINVIGQEDFSGHAENLTQDGLSSPLGLSYNSTDAFLYVADSVNNRVMVFDVAVVTDGEDAVDVYGQPDFVTGSSGVTQSTFTGPAGVLAEELIYVADRDNNRVMIFGAAATPTPTPTATPPGGGVGGGTPPRGEGFVPDGILINNDEPSVDSRNVLVAVFARFSNEFVGTIDVVLSNDPLFSTYIPFRYNVNNARIDSAGWPKTIAWDLCWGIPSPLCTPGPHRVYARFYVNTPVPKPALTPVPLFP